MQQKNIFYNKKQNKNTGHSAQLHVVCPSVPLFHLAILFMLSVLEVPYFTWQLKL